MDLNLLTKLLVISSFAFTLTGCGSTDNDSRVVLSTGDEIVVLNDLQYQLPIVVQVANLTGAPQADTTVSISLTATQYSEGFFTHIDTDGDGTTDTWSKTSSAVCAAEDINNNGKLDTGEDNNNNGFIDPDIPSITSHASLSPTLLGGTSTLITDSNGFGYFTLTYPKTEGSWVSVQLTATAEDGLAENVGQTSFRLFVLLADLALPFDDAPAFENSPYGIDLNCATPG